MTARKPSTPARRRANAKRPRDPKTGAYVTKFTPELGRQICDVIRAGNYIETAAAYAGVDPKTFRNWLDTGRNAMSKPKPTALEKHLIQFVADVEQALAQGEVRDLAIIGKAAENVWQAAAWRLERRMPQKYARRTRVEHDTPDGKPMPIALRFDPSAYTDEELEQLEQLMRKGQPDAEG